MELSSRCALAALVAILLLRGGAAGAQTLPAGFWEQVVFRDLTQPTAVRFAPDGRVFVAEKSGVIKLFRDLAHPTPTVFADLRTNVDDSLNRGLRGLALHPDFPRTPYVYVLYTLAAAPGATPPRRGAPGGSGDRCADPAPDGRDDCVVGARVSRLRAAGDVTAGGEEILLESWCQQYPSHSVGDLAFGEDRALYVSAGDGASTTGVDWGQHGRNVCGDPPEAGGALRAQSARAPGEFVSFDGAILRLDPETGAALPDNPRAGSTADDDRVIAFGLRHPVRLAPRPGTHELWVGDAGWRTWEEIDRVADVGDRVIENFGWPCFEGPERQPGYERAGLQACVELYASAGAVTAPFFAYRHGEPVVSGEACASGPGAAISALAFYRSGRYPRSYDGALFFADSARRCIWAMPLGPDGEMDPARRLTFEAGAATPVDLQTGSDGDLFYVDGAGGTIRRIRSSNPESARAVFHARATGGVPVSELRPLPAARDRG